MSESQNTEKDNHFLGNHNLWRYLIISRSVPQINRRSNYSDCLLPKGQMNKNIKLLIYWYVNNQQIIINITQSELNIFGLALIRKSASCTDQPVSPFDCEKAAGGLVATAAHWLWRCGEWALAGRTFVQSAKSRLNTYNKIPTGDSGEKLPWYLCYSTCTEWQRQS